MTFVLLILAIALFLTSTRQIRLHWRIPVWLFGAVLLAAAAALNVQNVKTGLLGVLARHPEMVAAAFRGNWATVSEYVGPSLDILILLAGLIGSACLVAFTPGDGLERFIRPINIGLLGAAIGGAIVLAISATGFGPVSKRKVFFGSITSTDVVDGDTFTMGDVSLRLWGIDAPEDHQICARKDGSFHDCGAEAAEALQKLITPGEVYCHAPAQSVSSSETQQLKESFGRPLVTCESDHQGYGKLPDIARELVRMGYAVPYETPGGERIDAYLRELKEAQVHGSGLHGGLFLPPTKWRNSHIEKCDFFSHPGPVVESNPEEQKRLTKQLADLRRDCGKS